MGRIFWIIKKEKIYIRSRFKCLYFCDICGVEVYKTKSQTEKITKGVATCSLQCLGKLNAIRKYNRVDKTCTMCGKSYNVIPANVDSVVCSVDCQKKWQSTFLIGENANNWKGGERNKPCEFCNDFYTCSSPYNFKHQRFCSDFCRIEYWKENTLHNEKFSKSWYEGNRRYRESLADRRVETRPERMVREWLDDNNIKYMQEQGFFRRYFADFFIPEEMLIIEVMGNYWHGNPNMYGNDKIPLNQEQIANM